MRVCLFAALTLIGTLALATEADPLASPDPWVRARAVRVAGQEQAPRVREMLSDPSWQVRAEAARALGRLRHVEAKRELMVRAQTDPSARVRQAAAEAVKQMDPRGFASVLATADPPPVQPAPPRPASTRSRGHDRAVLASVGLAANALRIDQTLAGQVATGLRWPHAEVQLTLSFPSLALAGQVRWSVLPRALLVPYLTGGAAVAYNTTDKDLGSAASAFVGAGLRTRPLARRLYLYAEVLANWVISQPRPAGETVELRRFALPVALGVGSEFWP